MALIGGMDMVGQERKYCLDKRILACDGVLKSSASSLFILQQVRLFEQKKKRIAL